MGIACIGVSRKDFQTFKKIEKTTTSAMNDHNKFRNINVQKDIVHMSWSQTSEIKQQFDQLTVQKTTKRVKQKTKHSTQKPPSSKTKENELNYFMKQKAQSPIQKQKAREKTFTLNNRITNKYFNN